MPDNATTKMQLYLYRGRYSKQKVMYMEPPFIGRKQELSSLQQLLLKKSASLVIVKGRRRIGKSRLIEEFAKKLKFYSFAGLAPTEKKTAQSERDEFARQLSEQTGLPEIKADDWSKLFLLLAEKTKRGRVILFFDKISWMGSEDPDFLGKLKNAWDKQFKKNPELILILCGSVSAWIEKNIIQSTGFLGRPSLYMNLEELPLHECDKFWGTQNQKISAYEKFKLLSVTGGIPRYLEQMNPSLPAEENIKRLCFMKESPLLNEFEYIFNDIFSKRSPIYKRIVEQLVGSAVDQETLAKAAGLTQTGDLSNYLNELLLSGFIARDYTWHLKSRDISKLSKYRLKDNYLRYYLKYLRPNKPKIEKGGFINNSLSSIPGWDTVMGLQFENLVVNNHHEVIAALGIRPEEVIFSNPFFQRQTARQPGCQIDYLIQTRFDTIYACEVKFHRSEIGLEIIDAMKEKIKRLKLPRHCSCRPVLIHVNGVREDVRDSGFFSHIINFGQLLESER